MSGDLSAIKAGDYELVSELWDEPTSKPGQPFTFERHRKGDIVTLDAEQARRLVTAGAVVEPGAAERAQVEALRAQYEAALAALGPNPAEAVAPTPDVGGSEVPEHLAGLTLADLQAYAGTNDIDLDGATKKDDIIAAIVKAESA